MRVNIFSDCCLGLLSSSMKENGEDMFELLDPLILDTQCHLHSLVILNILIKYYNEDQLAYEGVEKFEEKDKEILSWGVLLSLLKTETKDKFGFTIHNTALRDFEGLILNSRKSEKRFVTATRRKFNSHTVEFTKTIASEKVRDILTECQVRSADFSLKFLPYYASSYAVFDYMEKQKLPIIVPLINVNMKIIAGCVKYFVSNYEVRFYRFDKERNKFLYRKDLSLADKNSPTISFECYRLFNDYDINEEPLEPDQDDIRDILMLCSANHRQIPDNSDFPKGYEDSDEYVRNLYERGSEDLFHEYNEHYELAKKYNIIDAVYSKIVRSSSSPSFITDERSNNKWTSVVIERRREDIYFNIDHVYVSNYSRECKRLEVIGSSCEQLLLDQHEAFEIDVQKLPFEASRRILSNLSHTEEENYL